MNSSTNPVDIRPDHLAIVRDILRAHLPAGFEVWVFGSRANWTTKDSSDLDLAVEGAARLDYRIMGDLEIAFEESDLLYAVDVVDLKDVSPEFKNIVDSQKVPLLATADHPNPAEEWEERPFEEVIDFREGPGILAKDFREDGVPLVRLAGLSRGASVLAGCNYLDPESSAKRWDQFRLEFGDVLLSTSASLGRIAVVGEEGIGAVPYTGIIRMRPRDTTVHRPFIRYLLEGPDFQQQCEVVGVGSVIRHFGPMHLSPNPPKDTDGRREDSGRGWVRELQGRWPGVGVDGRSADGLQSPHRAPKALCGSCDARDGERIRSRGLSRPGWREIAGTLSQLQAGRQAGSGMARSRARARLNCSSQGQRRGRCRVNRRAERVIRPAKAKTRRLRVLVVTVC